MPRKLPEGVDGLILFFHIAAIAVAASNDDFTVAGIAIGSLIVASIICRGPKGNARTRAVAVVLERRIAARERRLRRSRASAE
jgi:hypothetical protein